MYKKSVKKVPMHHKKTAKTKTTKGPEQKQ